MILTSDPFGGATLASAGALLSYAAFAGASRAARRDLAVPLMLLAWGLHAASIAINLGDSPARFGFAPALSVTAWLVMGVYAVESRLIPQLQARWALAGLGGLAVVLAWLYPGAIVRLDGDRWVALHWALGLAAYGLFAAAVVHAWLMRRAERGMRQASGHAVGLPLLALERLMFRLLWAGFVLLTATLVAGWWVGHLDGGAKWQHKIVFSLLAWLTFAALLLGRARWGWRGLRATRMVYLGSGFLLLAYVGSRFVLEVILKR